MDTDGSMPSCLPGVPAGQGKKQVYSKDGSSTWASLLHQGLTLPLLRDQGWRGFAWDEGAQDSSFSEKHQLFDLWPPVSMLPLGGNVQGVRCM